MKISLHQYWDLLVIYLRPQRGRVLLLGALLLISIGVQLLNPQLLRLFIDSATRGDALQTLTAIAGLFLVVALFEQIFSVAASYLGENVGWVATNRLRSDLALHCLQLDMSFHNAHNPGELIERIDGDVAALGGFFARFVVHILGNLLMLVGVLVLLFRVDWRVGAALTVFAIVALVIVANMRDLAVKEWTVARQATASLFGFVEERVSGTEDIRASGATAFVMRRLYERLGDVLRTRRKAGVLSTTTGSTAVVLFTTGSALAFVLGAYLYNAGAITIGVVYLIFNYTEMLRQPIEQISRQLQDLQQAGASIGRIQALFALKPSVDDGGTHALPPGALSVEFADVSFAYSPPPGNPALPTPDTHSPSPTQLPTLQHIRLCLEPGKTLGLLGRTGSGKTTLTRLLTRLYDPVEGTIRLGGVDLRDAPLAEIRQRVGVVTQDIQLFHASVRDNLTFFDPAINDERIVAVLRELGLGAWLDALPDGLDTRLAPGGSGLSAGEAQLLAFTRVFLKDPGLVILDEASSRLDPATERRIDQAVRRLLQGRTGIIIAHRLGTVEQVDEIVILEDGRIAEQGPRAELVADPDTHFSRMLKTGLEEVLT